MKATFAQEWDAGKCRTLQLTLSSSQRPHLRTTWISFVWCFSSLACIWTCKKVFGDRWLTSCLSTSAFFFFFYIFFLSRFCRWLASRIMTVWLPGSLWRWRPTCSSRCRTWKVCTLSWRVSCWLTAPSVTARGKYGPAGSIGSHMRETNTDLLSRCFDVVGDARVCGCGCLSSCSLLMYLFCSLFILFRPLIGCLEVTCDLPPDVLTCRTLRQPSWHRWRQADRHLLPWRPAVHYFRDQVQSRPRRHGGQGSEINTHKQEPNQADCYWLAAVSLIWLLWFHCIWSSVSINCPVLPDAHFKTIFLPQDKFSSCLQRCLS